MTFSLKNYRLHESRVFRDPIHGYIRIYDLPCWQLINTKEMQRLRRIHQLGGTHQVYQTAEHSRFTHSLGVYEVVRRMLALETFDGLVNDYDRLTVLAAALLHDIGHGPFSHSFENVFHHHHELYTRSIILDEKTEVNAVLRAIDPHLPEDVADIISKEHRNPLLVQMVSSQIDGDRMDYLLRDSYFSGTAYGRFDLERILRTMRVHDGRIVFKESGIQAVENYILARYHMYWQVYYHPVTRAYEQLLVMIFSRLRYLFNHQFAFNCDLKFLIPFLKNEDVAVEAYLKLDESVLIYYFSCLEDCQDEILSDLCQRFLNRRLFKHRNLKDDQELASIREIVRKKGYDPDYYVTCDDASTTPYIHYGAGDEVQEIQILMAESNEVRTLPEVSEIVKAIVDTKMHKSDRKVYFPKEVKLDLQKTKTR